MLFTFHDKLLMGWCVVGCFDHQMTTVFEHVSEIYLDSAASDAAFGVSGYWL